MKPPGASRHGEVRLDEEREGRREQARDGDVVWNSAEQKGYLRFHGSPKNDKYVSVYQLWIFDKSRDDKYPVDGGVFEIDDDTGDVVVPIDTGEATGQ